MALTSLSVKGQVVIPKEVREALDLRPGTKLLVSLEGESIILKPIKRSIATELYSQYKGIDLLADLQEEHRREVRQESG